MSQKTLNLCLERYSFVKFGETTKSSHTVLCINNAYSVNSDKYRLTPTAIASKHGEGYVFTLNYDFDRPLFTIVQKSYTLDGTSGNIVFEGIDPISKGGSKYLRKVTVSPVKLSDGSYLLEITNDEYLRIGTTGAALGDEELESLNEKIVTMGGIEKSVETVGGKQVLKLDASGSAGAKEIVYFDVDPSVPPSGIYEAIGEALANNKEPVIKNEGAVYFYSSTGTDKYVFVGGYDTDVVKYTTVTVSDDDSVVKETVDTIEGMVFPLYYHSNDEGFTVADKTGHALSKTEIVNAYRAGQIFMFSSYPASNTQAHWGYCCDINIDSHNTGYAEFFILAAFGGNSYEWEKYRINLSSGTEFVTLWGPNTSYSTGYSGSFANASDVTALQSQVSSLSNVSAYTVKGEATVAQLNAGPSGIQAGWAYQLTDSGTLTDGSLAVVAGDTVAWDGTKWFPLVKSDYYATKTYAQNVAHSIAPEFDPTRDEDHKYLAGQSVMYNGALRTFQNDHYGAWNEADVYNLENSITGKWLNHVPNVFTFGATDKVIIYNSTDGWRVIPAQTFENLIATSANQKDRLAFYFDRTGTAEASVGVYGKYNTESNAVFINYVGWLSVQGTTKGVSRSRRVNIIDLAAELGVSLETAPNGVANCLKIEDGRFLVYDTSSNTFAIRQYDSVITANDVILIGARNAAIVCGVLCPVINYYIQQNTHKIRAYARYENSYIECAKSTAGSVFFSIGSLHTPVPVNISRSMSDIATELGVSLVTSPKGIANCLEVSHGKALVLTCMGGIELKNDSDVTNEDIVVISCRNGRVTTSVIDQNLIDRMADAEDTIANVSELSGSTALSYASSDFADDLLNVAGDCDTFLFLSDIHCFDPGTNVEVYDAFRAKILDFLKKVTKSNALTKVLCAGDILTSNDTPAEAVRKLSWWFGMTKNEHAFTDFITAVGNHEVNERGTEALSQAQVNAVMFPDIGNAYFVKEMTNTALYVLDSGAGDDHTMSAYRWAQIDWLANAVLQNSKLHGIVMLHIYSSGDTEENFNSHTYLHGENLQLLCGAINNRTTITLNGITYDFSTCTQKIACILCGHTHIDVINYDRAVPVVCIANTWHQNPTTYAVDACVLDYAAAKLRMTRLGGFGESRVVDIVV